MILPRLCGLFCAFGGVTLFCDLALRLLSGIGPSYFLVAALIALSFATGALGLRLLGAFAPGWRSVVGWVGMVITFLGAAMWVAAFGMLYVDPAAAFTQKLTPGGSLLMAFGMILTGVATLASGEMRGWRAFVPLVVGLYFPLQLLVQLTFFLNGGDGAPGPNGTLLGAWGLLWALLGLVVATHRRNERARPSLAVERG